MGLDLDRYTLAQNRARQEVLQSEESMVKKSDEAPEAVTGDIIDEEKSFLRRMPVGVNGEDKNDSVVAVEFELDGSITSSQSVQTEDVLDVAPRVKPEVISIKPKPVLASVISAEPKIKKSVNTAQIRDFPRELLNVARSEFPEATTQTDALAAYVAVKSGLPVDDISDDVRDLIGKYEGDQTLQDIEKHMRSIEAQVRSMSNMVQELELGLAFIIYDRLGFRLNNPSSPRDVDLLEGEMLVLVARLKEQTKKAKRQENVRLGRPMR